MAEQLISYKYLMPAAGATRTFALSEIYEVYYLEPTGGAITLAANLIISVSGTPVYGMVMNFKYGGGVTVGANQVTILGTALTAAQALAELDIQAFYNGSAWMVFISIDNQAGVVGIDGSTIVDQSIPKEKIEDSSIGLAKMWDIARGSIIVGGAANAPTYKDFKTSGAIAIGDGTDINSVVPTGDVLISSAGVMTIQPASVTAAMLNFTPVTYYEATLSLSSAQILALNTAEQQIIASPGANKYIDVVSATYKFTYATAVYATNTRLQVITSAGDTAMLQDDGALISSTLKYGKFVPAAAPAAGVSWMNVNRAVNIKVATGDPTAGSGTIVISVLYRIVEI